jgi:hypothetical protein
MQKLNNLTLAVLTNCPCPKSILSSLTFGTSEKNVLLGEKQLKVR